MFCQRDLSQQVIDAQRPLPLVCERKPTDASPRHQGSIRPFNRRVFSPSTAENLGKRAGHSDNPRQGHGRRERRTLTATTALNDYLNWPGVAQVGQLDVVEQNGTSQLRPATSSPALRGNSRTQVSCSDGHEATGQSRIGPITCTTITFGEDASRIERLRSKSWPPSKCDHRLPPLHRRDKYCRDTASELLPSRKTLHHSWYLQKVNGPGATSRDG